ncbi:hypothetical protein ASZ90_013442 [hydrocarbon metagenome]|uniref:Uncharacterized protein n=1 Tax=hydrocarbon metagenome TaxID=938273 RepID=A0A0W8F7K9_9ZZZZ
MCNICFYGIPELFLTDAVSEVITDSGIRKLYVKRMNEISIFFFLRPNPTNRPS